MEVMDGEAEWAQSLPERAENGTIVAIHRKWYAQPILQGGIMTTDPVCGMKVDERRSEFQTQFAGKKYFFCSDECRKEFEADPNEYVETAAA